MKYLKKVSASQLISNTGTIIDSMNPGDDQTVNAPSIHAVKDYVENYSTTEQRIGTWMGKPLYRKVVDMGSMPLNNSKSVAHNVSNLKFVVSQKAFAYAPNDSTAQFWGIPHVGNAYMSGSVSMAMRVTNTDINVYCSSTSFGAYVCYAIIEYTKTTD